MTLRRTLTAAILAASTVLPIGAATAATPAENISYNDALVHGWYVGFLNRFKEEVDNDPGRMYWVHQLDAGVPPIEVLGALLRTRAYAEEAVHQIYGRVLTRNVDPGGEYWIDQIKRGVPAEWVEQNVLASPEAYYAWSPGGRYDEYYVAFLYQRILGRKYDQGLRPSGEEAYWANRLKTTDRLTVVREIWYSPEGVRNRLLDHYVFLLGRHTVDPDGLNYWYNREVSSDIRTGMEIATTPEFVKVHHGVPATN